MRKWTKSRHCTGGRHCRACRGDAAWRKLMEKDYEMPNECPYPNVMSKSVIKLPPEAAATCERCDGRGCPNVRTCCGGQRDVNIVVACPRGDW